MTFPLNLWDVVDYAPLARRLQPAAETVGARVTELIGPGAGRRAVDLGAGDGSLAVALARSGWRVDAVDGSAAMVDRGRARTGDHDHGMEVTWHLGDLARLPLPNECLEAAGSSFGLIFAPDPVAALDEVARVLLPGGTLVMSAWTPTGYMAEMTAVMAQFLPGPAPSAPTWGEESELARWLSLRWRDVRRTEHALAWHFDSPAAGRDFLFKHSPAHLACERLAGERAAQLRAAVEHHLAGLSDTTGRVRTEATYAVTSAVRA